MQSVLEKEALPWERRLGFCHICWADQLQKPTRLCTTGDATSLWENARPDALHAPVHVSEFILANAAKLKGSWSPEHLLFWFPPPPLINTSPSHHPKRISKWAPKILLGNQMQFTNTNKKAFYRISNPNTFRGRQGTLLLHSWVLNGSQVCLRSLCPALWLHTKIIMTVWLIFLNLLLIP